MTKPFYTQWEYAFKTKTTQGYVEDVWSVNDAVKVNFGFKAVKDEVGASTIQGSPVLKGTITSKDGFLPQVGVSYKINNDHELFAGYTENMRAFGGAHTGASPFAGNQATFDLIIGTTKLANGKALTLQPETSKTLEAGWRFNTGDVQGVAAVYYVEFKNRLLGNSTGAGIVGNPTVLSNVGGVKSKGLETAATWKVSDAWSLFGSYAYNDSTWGGSQGHFRQDGDRHAEASVQCRTGL